MKNLKFVLIALFGLSIVACDSDNININILDIDVKDERIRVGEDLEVEISGRDSDGIESIQIIIDGLDVDVLIDNGPDNNRWKVERDFLIEDTIASDTYIIEVILTDKDGNEESDFENFTVL